ncbi:hypothetical protein R3W88_028984 [Solanum pinnatisectum]|uniref:RNase H type-1 domain-containing protein n=1 Tax=Solanum pinnatisectum TaxID=50273 RepID=A0AAV9K3Z7_9SOLN|nr:hypothetical protein R3W88_028984 [Solanum pinnatisectum]
MAFLMWRLWKFKIPVDDRVRRWGVQGPSKCWCCESPNQETLAHVFLKSYTTNRTWSYFCSFAGLNTASLNLREVIMLWWGSDIKKDMKPYYRAVPCFAIWELWRRRNKMKHKGKKASLPRVIHNVTRNIFMLIQLRKPRIRCPLLWPEMLKELDAYRTKMKVTKVIWEFPPASWVKYNTDGASRGNPGLSSYAFCLRDDKGDIMYAKGKMIETTTNTVAEAKAKAILETSKHCNQSNHTRIIIQTDSMLLCKVLEGKWTTPWIITDMVAEIRTYLQNKQHIFQHILREGNQLAYYLANIAIDEGNCILTDYKSIEPEGKKIIISDKLKCPYLRVSPVKG